MPAITGTMSSKNPGGGKWLTMQFNPDCHRKAKYGCLPVDIDETFSFSPSGVRSHRMHHKTGGITCDVESDVPGGDFQKLAWQAFDRSNPLDWSAAVSNHGDTFTNWYDRKLYSRTLRQSQDAFPDPTELEVYQSATPNDTFTEESFTHLGIAITPTLRLTRTGRWDRAYKIAADAKVRNDSTTLTLLKHADHWLDTRRGCEMLDFSGLSANVLREKIADQLTEDFNSMKRHLSTAHLVPESDFVAARLPPDSIHPSSTTNLASVSASAANSGVNLQPETYSRPELTTSSHWPKLFRRSGKSRETESKSTFDRVTEDDLTDRDIDSLSLAGSAHKSQSSKRSRKFRSRPLHGATNVFTKAGRRAGKTQRRRKKIDKRRKKFEKDQQRNQERRESRASERL